MNDKDKMRLWLFIIKPRLGIKEGQILPWHAMIIKTMLFPINGMRWLLMSRRYRIKWRQVCSPTMKLMLYVDEEKA